MEKGPKPFSEEKAKEIMEAEGLEERSQSEQDAFEAGYGAGVKSDEQKKIKQREKEREWNMAVAREEKERKIKERIDDIYRELTAHTHKGVDFDEVADPRWLDMYSHLIKVQPLKSVEKMEDRIIVTFANGKEVIIDPCKKVIINFYRGNSRGGIEWGSRREFNAIR